MKKFIILILNYKCIPTVRMCRQCRYVLDAIYTIIMPGILCTRRTRLGFRRPLTPLNAVVVKGHKKRRLVRLEYYFKSGSQFPTSLKTLYALIIIEFSLRYCSPELVISNLLIPVTILPLVVDVIRTPLMWPSSESIDNV